MSGYRQSETACCPRQTIPDSCSCPDDCDCACLDCDCQHEDPYRYGEPDWFADPEDNPHLAARREGFE